MKHLFRGKEKEEQPSLTVRPRTPLERIFGGEEVKREEIEQHAAMLREREEKRKSEKKRLEEEC